MPPDSVIFVSLLLKLVEDFYKQLKDLVDEHAIPIAIVTKQINTEILVNDFVYFCVAKTCKSTGAIIALLKQEYPEDALIILRSVYENYLSIGYLLKNPANVDDLVFKRVGLAAGVFVHPLTPKNKRDTRKLLDPASGEIYDFGLTIGELARGALRGVDLNLHSGMYPYLCEHVHSNMIASGNYRNTDETRYTYKDNSNTTLARFWTCVTLYLFFETLLTYEPINIMNNEDHRNILNMARSTIASGVKQFDSRDEDLKQLISKKFSMDRS